MCTNYEPVTDVGRLLAAFGVSLPAGVEPDPYSSVGRLAPFIVRAKVRPAGALGEAKVGLLGLLPDWAQSIEFCSSTYNCRAESAKTKPAFKDSWWAGRRCVIPVEKISEWCYETASGEPEMWSVQRADGEAMGLAGLWNEWTSPQGEKVLSFTMLTINADGHGVFGHLNHRDHEKRMPVILPNQAAQEAWLYGTTTEAEQLLVRFPAEDLHAGPREVVPKPLKEPSSWESSTDMFADEWRATAAEVPRKKSSKARNTMPPPPPERPGPLNGDLFG